MVFHIIPTALEISLVCGILVSLSFDPIGVRLLHFPDMAVWLQIRSHYSRDHGWLFRLYHFDNIMEDQISQGCQRR